MADEPAWGEDTVALGGFGSEPGEPAEEAISEPPAAAAPEVDAEWGEETVALGIGDEAEREAPMVPVGRREPTKRRPRFAVLAIGTAIVVLVAIVWLSGSEQQPTPAAPVVEPRPVERQDPAVSRAMEKRVEQGAESRRRAEWIAREHRQARERQLRARKAARSKAPGADPNSSPEYAPEAEPEYVPEYTPEPVPEATPSPEAAPSAPASTPPAVEFGM